MKTKTLLAALLLSLSMIAGVLAQTGAMNAVSVNTSVRAFCKAGNLVAAESAARAAISGSYSYAVTSTSQEASNAGIWWTANILRTTSGKAAAHDFLIESGCYSVAADTSLEVGLPARAIAEYAQAASADPSNAKVYNAASLAAKRLQGMNVNASVISAINGWGGMIPLESAQRLYSAWIPVGVSGADNIAFYNLLLSAVEINKRNAAFVGKIIDQKAKLAQ